MNGQINYPEDFVIWLWENKYLSSNLLTTVDNQEYRLIYRGNRNSDVGPDFLNVSFEHQNKIITGSVEIHVHPSDWYHHGHATDAIYNQVILHVVLENPTSASSSQREDGLSVPIIILTDHLSHSLDSLYQRYCVQKQRAGVQQTTCGWQQADQTTILALLDRAGAARLTLKGLAMRELRIYDSWDQLLYAGIMEALGYSKNQVPFRKLAAHLPIEFIFREIRTAPPETVLLKVQGLLFGAAGLLPGQSRQSEADFNLETEKFCAELEAIWQEFRHRIGLQPLHPNEWKFFRLRPQNFPTRRLAGMCHLLANFYADGLFKNFLRVFTGLKNIDQINAELEKMLICEAEGFWKKYYQFDKQRPTNWRPQLMNLIGSDRARDMIVNIILPLFLLCAHECGDGQLEATVKECYRRFPPLADNVITREMQKKIFPHGQRPKRVVNSAQKQQGLIHLYKNYCQNQKCEACLQF